MSRTPPVLLLLLLLASLLVGGIAPRVQAAQTATLLSGPHVGSFEATPDGAFAVFHRSQSYAGPTQVYIVPISGGESVTLNAPVPPPNIFPIAYASPNRRYVVYHVGPDYNNMTEIYSIALDTRTVEIGRAHV